MHNTIIDETRVPQRVSANDFPVGTFYKGGGKCLGLKVSPTTVFLFTDVDGKAVNQTVPISGDDGLTPVNVTLRVSL